MATRTWPVMLFLLACGGEAAEPEAESEQQELQMLEGFAVDVSVCTPAPQYTSGFCNACFDGTVVPRCFGTPDPGPRPEPAACRAPDCERPLESELPARTPAADLPVTELRGACADGKTFDAELGAFDGHVQYRRDGVLVGTASYTAMIGKCECSGESYAGDAACVVSAYEVIAGAQPSGDVRLPFADGKRVAPCLCRD